MGVFLWPGLGFSLSWFLCLPVGSVSQQKSFPSSSIRTSSCARSCTSCWFHVPALIVGLQSFLVLGVGCFSPAKICPYPDTAYTWLSRGRDQALSVLRSTRWSWHLAWLSAASPIPYLCQGRMQPYPEQNAAPTLVPTRGNPPVKTPTQQGCSLTAPQLSLFPALHYKCMPVVAPTQLA